jgi:hypothetical protein
MMMLRLDEGIQIVVRIQIYETEEGVALKIVVEFSHIPMSASNREAPISVRLRM